MSDMGHDNPVLVELTRGTTVESCHRGAIAVADAQGERVLGLGDVESPILPRSAIKALQAMILVESCAADAFGLSDAELAVACASHSGDPVHIEAVRSLLGKAGLDESALACGAHWPISEKVTAELMRAGKHPLPIHNNCSGKHAGMLASAVHLGLDPRGYERPDHALQIRIGRLISEICGIRLSPDHAGIDGCSVPTWPLSLDALAQGFARFATGAGLAPARGRAAASLRRACFAHPVLVAGEGRFDTVAMASLAPSVFVKGGAEGVHCAALPELGLGIAVKVDDGAKRGAERAIAEVLAALVPEARTSLAGELEGELANWRGMRVGQIVASADLLQALAALETAARRAETSASSIV